MKCIEARGSDSRTSKKKKILLVDDDGELSEFMCSLLRKQGYSVHSCPNGKEALHFLRKHELPDLLLIDIRMPVMDGLTFLKRLMDEKRRFFFPIILMSSEDPQENQRGYRWNAFLKKPLQFNELSGLLNQLLPNSP